MPNTKSAERRMRNNETKRVHNRSIKSRLKTLETRFVEAVGAGKKTEAQTELRLVASALDKAAKTGVIHHAKADRKKSRLTLQVNALK